MVLIYSRPSAARAKTPFDRALRKFGGLVVSLLLALGALAADPRAAFGQKVPDQLSKPPVSTTDDDIGPDLLRANENWKGDFDGMRERRLIRILVPLSKTLYTVDSSGQHHGIMYEMGEAFRGWLNRKYKTRSLQIEVMYIPVARDQLIASLNEGKGDIIAAAMTITPERQAVVDFSEPLARGVKEVLVTGPTAPPIKSLNDLSGREIFARESSSYFTHLAALSKTFEAAGRKPILLKPIDEELEDEDLLDMVNARLLPWVVVDRYKGMLWANVLPSIVVRQDLEVNAFGSIAFAIRKGSPLLKKELDGFVAQHKIGSAYGNALLTKYLKGGAYAKRAMSKENVKKFEAISQIIQTYASKYDFDHLMVAAQGYQESQLNQAARSPRGAVGVMQLLPSTAADPAIGIRDVDKSAERNIEAGTKYLRLLVERYLDDPEIDAKNRTLMAFAAYNAGPGNLNKFRRLAKKAGLNPNVWFQNVEVAASRVVGRETVQYVANIYKYYVAYRLVQEQNEAREKARAEMKPN